MQSTETCVQDVGGQRKDVFVAWPSEDKSEHSDRLLCLKGI
jgi:hypothetical protein